MRCKQAIELVSDRTEDALAAAKRDSLDAHLAACRDCSLYAAQMAATVAAVRTLAVDNAVDPELYRKLLAMEASLEVRPLPVERLRG